MKTETVIETVYKFSLFIMGIGHFVPNTLSYLNLDNFVPNTLSYLNLDTFVPNTISYLNLDNFVPNTISFIIHELIRTWFGRDKILGFIIEGCSYYEGS